MTDVILSLNIDSTLSNYDAYVSVYQVNQTSYVYGESYPYLAPLSAVYENGTIVFKPLVLNDSNDFWFLGGKPPYVPNKWINASLYQQINTNLNNNFIFKGKFISNTLHSVYSQSSSDDYTVNAYIYAFNSSYNIVASVYSPTNQTGNFSIELDTTSMSDIILIQWGFVMKGYPVYPTEAGNQGSAVIGDYTYPCFKEDTKILTNKGYIPIQNLRKGDLVKTLNDNFKPIDMIGKKEIYHPASDERIKYQLYKCSKDKFPEIFEELIITGCHSILIDNFINNEQKNKTFETLGDIYITDNKYRLPACVDSRTTVYENQGNHTIYHLALENDEYYFNYGIYANGLLVESCSKRYLKELSSMTLIE